MIDNAVSDLPLPDSPTRHSVSPAATPKLTSITAGTNRPPNSKPVVRWETDRSRCSLLAARGWMVELPTAVGSWPCIGPSCEPPAASREACSSDIDFLVFAEHRAHGVGDLADGSVCLDRANDVRHEIV